MRKLILAALMTGAAFASCNPRVYDCSEWPSHPREAVVYSDSEWWGAEKWPSATHRAMQVLPRRHEVGAQWSLARSPQDLGVLFHLEDCFDQSPQIYAHTARIEDDQGNPHVFRLEWAGYWQTRNRALGILNRRQYFHSLRATVDGRVLFSIDDRVEDGLYEYEDFFRLGNRSFRILVRMNSKSKQYDFEAMLMAYRPVAQERVGRARTKQDHPLKALRRQQAKEGKEKGK